MPEMFYHGGPRLTLPLDIKFNKYASWLENEEAGAIANLAKGTWSLNDNGEGIEIHGKITKKGLEVTDINCVGDGSGNIFEEFLKPFKNGVVKEKEIDS